MALFRSFAAAALAAALTAAGGGFAVAGPPPWAHGNGHHKHAAGFLHGAVSGRIVGVNYGAAVILVGTRGGTVPIAVTPSTSIFRGSRFASFSDLGPGARVDVDVANVGGRLVAQIIRIH